MTVSRRVAIKRVAGVGAALVTGVAPLPGGRRARAEPGSANERIHVAVVGTGVRGKYLIGNLPPSVRVSAICDCAESRIANTLKPSKRFAEILTDFRTQAADRCATYQDYRRLFEKEKLDAVIISTPDHHHVQAALLALEAGLDVYLEKPLSVTVAEGRVLAERVKSSGRVLQVGSQQRTMEMNRFACSFIRDGGLGHISRIDFPNYPGPMVAEEFPAEPLPKGLDWDLFLGPTPQRPHNRKLWVKDEFKVGDLTWRGWDLFREYSGHLMTNWGAHSIDMVQYALGMDASGPVKISPAEQIDEAALEKDWQSKWAIKTPHPTDGWGRASRFRPVTLEYGNGTLLRLLPGVGAATFYGERGKMTISRNRFRCEPAELVRHAPDAQVARLWSGKGFVARPHLKNWLGAIRGLEQLNAPVEVGHRTVTVCHLVNICREIGLPLEWDPIQEKFVGNEQANRLLSRPRREGFELPG